MTHVRHTITLNTACLQVHRDRGGAGGRRPAGFAGRGRVGGPCRMVPTDQRRGGAAGHRSGVSSPPSCLEWCRYVRTVCTVSWRLATHICTHEPRYRQSTCTYRTRLHFVRLCVSQSCAGSLERGQAGTYVRTCCMYGRTCIPDPVTVAVARAEERSFATWCAASATSVPSCARRRATTSFGSW